MSARLGKAEIVAAVIEALNRGDLEGALKGTSPEFRWDNTRSLGFERRLMDRDGLLRWWAGFEAAWASVRVDLTDSIDVGDHLVTPFTNTFTGRDGIATKASGTFLWTFEAGDLVRLTLYQELEEAMQTAVASE